MMVMMVMMVMVKRGSHIDAGDRQMSGSSCGSLPHDTPAILHAEDL